MFYGIENMHLVYICYEEKYLMQFFWRVHLPKHMPGKTQEQL